MDNGELEVDTDDINSRVLEDTVVRHRIYQLRPKNININRCVFIYLSSMLDYKDSDHTCRGVNQYIQYANNIVKMMKKPVSKEIE